PAAAAGLRPGDRVVSVGGRPVSDWEELSRAIRAEKAGPVQIGIERDGRSLTLTANLIAQERESLDKPGTYEIVGYLGISPKEEIQRQDLGAVVVHMGDLTARTAVALVNLPQKMVGVWEA